MKVFLHQGEMKSVGFVVYDDGSPPRFAIRLRVNEMIETPGDFAVLCSIEEADRFVELIKLRKAELVEKGLL